MAITLNDLKERIENVKQDLEQQNFGLAYTKIGNIVTLLENSGITIHAIATVESKKVESHGSNQEEE